MGRVPAWVIMEWGKGRCTRAEVEWMGAGATPSPCQEYTIGRLLPPRRNASRDGDKARRTGGRSITVWLRMLCELGSAAQGMGQRGWDFGRTGTW